MLFGERGVGKTSLANVLSEYLELTDEEEEEKFGPIISPRVNCDSDDTFDTVWRKILDRIELSRTVPSIGFGAEQQDMGFVAAELLGTEYRVRADGAPDLTPAQISHVLARLGKQSIPILIVDEFDRLDAAPRRVFADLIKMLSDDAVPATVVLVGVADTVAGLLKDHESVGRALVQVHMPRMGSQEIQEILTRGAARLGMTVEPPAVDRVAAISQGLPHYAHLIGLHATRAAIEHRSLTVTTEHVNTAVQQAIVNAQQSVQRAYHEAIRSAQRGSLFADVLLACAMAKCDELGYFKAQDVRPPMCQITGKSYDIPNFAQHLSDFTGEKRGRILDVVGEKRRLSYHFRDPLMQPFVLMQGIASGRLPEDFFSQADT